MVLIKAAIAWNILCYANDTVLIAENEDNLQRLLYKFYKSWTELNLKILNGKTKFMTK